LIVTAVAAVVAVVARWPGFVVDGIEEEVVLPLPVSEFSAMGDPGPRFWLYE
jgi:hypothetical protein